MAATSALEMMERYSLKQMPVVDHEEMVGWIDHESLMSALRLRMEAGD
jgi:predicted transcriptional regulator